MGRGASGLLAALTPKLLPYLAGSWRCRAGGGLAWPRPGIDAMQQALAQVR